MCTKNSLFNLLEVDILCAQREVLVTHIGTGLIDRFVVYIRALLNRTEWQTSTKVCTGIAAHDPSASSRQWFWLYTIRHIASFRCPHKWKSKMVKSNEHGRYSKFPPLPLRRNQSARESFKQVAPDISRAILVWVPHHVDSKISHSHTVDEWQATMDIQSKLRYEGTVTVPSKNNGPTKPLDDIPHQTVSPGKFTSLSAMNVQIFKGPVKAIWRFTVQLSLNETSPDQTISFTNPAFSITSHWN